MRHFYIKTCVCLLLIIILKLTLISTRSSSHLTLHAMSLRLALAFLVLAVAGTYGERVSCREARRSDGSLGFDCVSVVPVQDLTAQNLYVLWLKSSRQGGDQSLDINVPNYKIDDVIQAAAKGADANSHTNINVNLQRPEFSYTAQKEDAVGRTSQSFDVNLQYDRVNGRAVHFSDDGQGSERYAPLNGRIQEPPLRFGGRQ